MISGGGAWSLSKVKLNLVSRWPLVIACGYRGGARWQRVEGWRLVVVARVVDCVTWARLQAYSGISGGVSFPLPWSSRRLHLSSSSSRINEQSCWWFSFSVGVMQQLVSRSCLFSCKCSSRGLVSVRSAHSIWVFGSMGVHGHRRLGLETAIFKSDFRTTTSSCRGSLVPSNMRLSGLVVWSVLGFFGWFVSGWVVGSCRGSVAFRFEDAYLSVACGNRFLFLWFFLLAWSWSVSLFS